MKKISVILCVLVFLMTFSACGQNVTENQNANENKYIVCTTFAAYDWAKEIIGKGDESISVRFVGDNGDTHSYQPTLQDVATIAVSELIVFVGGESDKWVEKTVSDEDLNALRLFDVHKDALIVEEHDEHHTEHEEDLDEHIWLSLEMAEKSVDALCEKICELDSARAEYYKKNAEAYCERLRDLDNEYRKAVNENAEKRVVFADRFPFRYMMEDYGIECIAAFTGCSADQDASFEVIARLAKAVDEYNKKTVLVLENSNQSVAETVIKSTTNKNAGIAVMNSCQTISAQDIANGATYFDIMEENLVALKKALE